MLYFVLPFYNKKEGLATPQKEKCIYRLWEARFIYSRKFTSIKSTQKSRPIIVEKLQNDGSKFTLTIKIREGTNTLPKFLTIVSKSA